MKHHITVIILILLTNQFCYSQNNQQNVIKLFPIDSLTSLTLKSLETKKIVMLGDAYHGNLYYFKMVIGVLNAWLDKLENNSINKNIPHKLFLFLEIDSISFSNFNQVLEHGISENTLKYSIDMVTKYGGWEKNSVDIIQFQLMLREILERITEINKTNSINKIELVVHGPEGIPPFNYSAIIKMGNEKYQKEKFIWFAKERDRTSSKNIIKLLDNENEFKALIFYGTAHLIRKQIDKAQWSEIPNQEPINEYYLAHFLDEHFGRDKVDIYFPYNSFHTAGNYIEQHLPNNDEPDYIIYCNVIPENPFSLYLIKNKMILKAISELTDVYKKSSKPEDMNLFIGYSRMFYNHARRSYLYYEPYYKSKIDSLAYYPFHLKDKELAYTNTKRISDELISEFDVIKNIEKMDKWFARSNFPNDSLLFQMVAKPIIYNLPKDTIPGIFYNELRNSNNRNYFDTFEQNQINKRIKELKIYYAINLSWVNTPEENQKLFYYLKEKTGCNFTTTKDWNEWLWKKHLRIK